MASSKFTRISGLVIPFYLNEAATQISWDTENLIPPSYRLRRRSGTSFLRRHGHVAVLVAITFVPVAVVLLVLAMWDYQRVVDGKVEGLRLAAGPVEARLKAARGRERAAEGLWLGFKGRRMDRRTRFERELAREELVERVRERKVVEEEAGGPLWRVREMERWRRFWWVLWVVGEREPGGCGMS